jgi:hypothetical protein
LPKPTIELAGEVLSVAGGKAARPAHRLASASHLIEQIPHGESRADIRIGV